MENERFWEDIETGCIYDTENNDFFDPVETLNKQADEIVELKYQLAEKDKEIEKYISALEYNENNIPNQRRAIYHQVCEEIRNEAYFDHYTDCDGKTQIVYCIEPEKLKEIEQGE